MPRLSLSSSRTRQPGGSSSSHEVIKSSVQTRHMRALAERRAAQREKKALRRLEIPEYAASLGGSGLTTPLGTRWTVVTLLPPTPVAALAGQPSHLVLPVIEVAATAARYALHTPSGSPPHRLLQTVLAGGTTAASGSSQKRGFQLFREALWKHGPGVFGKTQDADVFVRAVRLPGASSPSSSSSSAKASAADDRLTVRAVLRSKEGAAAVGLKRQFELKKLRATIPEPLPSPHSPNFDRQVLLSALKTPCEDGRKAAAAPLSSTAGSGEDADAIAVPMHTSYARAQLPALAAIIMSTMVRRGDTIDLGMPRPDAWSETVAYVYTGELELLSAPVRENILYLGGRV